MTRVKWALAGTLALCMIVYIAFQDPHLRWPARVMSVQQALDELAQAVEQEQWAMAEPLVEEVADRWNKAQIILYLNSQPLAMSNFSRQLARVAAAVKRRDAATARLELAELYDIWQTLLSW